MPQKNEQKQSMQSRHNHGNQGVQDKKKVPMALAQVYDSKISLDGSWSYMEKFDGFFGHWSANQRKLYSRQGRELTVPESLKDKMPHVDVNGELWAGYNQFNAYQGLFNGTDVDNPMWNNVEFKIFDVVEPDFQTMSFVERMSLLETWSEGQVQAVKVFPFVDMNDMKSMFAEIVARQGEGIMLRKNLPFKEGRSSNLLKYKKQMTVDAKVVGYKKGTGMNANAVGSMILETKENETFGCVPIDRRNPPHIGAIVEVSCLELTDRGVPRFPVMVRERFDISW